MSTLKDHASAEEKSQAVMLFETFNNISSEPGTKNMSVTLAALKLLASVMRDMTPELKLIFIGDVTQHFAEELLSIPRQ